MKPPIRIVALSTTLLIASLALAGCGNKGPLIRASDVPASKTPAATPAADPAATPASEPASGTPAAPR